MAATVSAIAASLQMSEQLKPCPFCGGEGRIEIYALQTVVACIECRATAGPVPVPHEWDESKGDWAEHIAKLAVESWETRHVELEAAARAVVNAESEFEAHETIDNLRKVLDR